MPNPKRKHSKTRTRSRRTHDNALAPTYMICTGCGAPVLYHRICTDCGTYRGKKVFEVEAVV